MANTYKNIVIVPNIGSNIADPRIVFSGANNTVNTDITLSVNPSTNGTISIDGDRQLFSVTNSMVGIHFSVNNANGIPNIEITDSGIIRLAQYTGSVNVGGQLNVTSIVSTGAIQSMVGAGTPNLDITPSTYTIANNGTIDFSNMAGVLFQIGHTTANIVLWFMNGGTTSAISNLSGVTGTLTYVAGISGYRWTNNTGSSQTLTFFSLRGRTVA